MTHHKGLPLLLLSYLFTTSHSRNLQRPSSSSDKALHDTLGASRISHTSRDTLSVPPESLLISHLAQTSNEISHEVVSGVTQDFQKKHLPFYLELIQPHVVDGVDETPGTEEPTGPLVRAWFPVQFTRSFDSEGTSTTLVFHQSQRREILKAFVKAQLILTLRPEAVSFKDLFVVLHAGQKLLETKLLSQGIQYFTLNITRFLTEYLETHDAPSQLELRISISSKSDSSENRFLEEVFDLEDEKPGIILFYKNSQDIPQQSQVDARRNKRSVEAASLPPPVEFQPDSPQSPLNLTCSSNCSSVPLSPPPPQVISNSSPTTPTSVSDQFNLCRKVEWSVSVEDIDWGDVVSHKKISLGYCTGDCPFPLENEHYNFTLHSFFLDKYKRNKHSAMPSTFPRCSSCVPIKYNPIRVWLEEEERVFVFMEYDNVLVDSCGCR